jgi:membrane associated rhomboid family serine protease
MFGRLTPVVKVLLLINVGVFAVGSLFGLQDVIVHYFALRYINAELFAPYQFVTYMFLHADFYHLLGNMFALFVFGPALEHLWGSKNFLTYYMVCGLGAAILFGAIDYVEKSKVENDTKSFINAPTPDKFSDYVASNIPVEWGQAYNIASRLEPRYYEAPDNSSIISECKDLVSSFYSIISNVPMLGASGAVFGILIGFGLLFPNTVLVLLFPPIPVKAKYLVAFYAVYEIFYGIRQVPGDNVAHYAHIGGMLVGYLLIRFWLRAGNNYRY